MLKIVILGIAISLVSGQNFKQVQTFPAQTTHYVQQATQPEIHIQPQQNPSNINDEAAQNYRQSVAHTIRENLARQKQAPTNIESFPADYPVDPLNDPNIPIVEINNQPAVRQPHIARPRPRPRLQRINVAEQLQEEEVENVPQQYRVRKPVAVTPVRQQVVHSAEEDAETARYLRKQAENAHYSFDSSVQDTINDHSITRQETRDGLALKGMYSYSDGFFRRTVHYEADEHGYRVTKEEIDPIGDGPQYNANGKADVSSSLIGGYSITADDVRDTRVKEPIRRQEINDQQIRVNQAPERRHRFEAGRA